MLVGWRIHMFIREWVASPILDVFGIGSMTFGTWAQIMRPEQIADVSRRVRVIRWLYWRTTLGFMLIHVIGAWIDFEKREHI